MDGGFKYRYTARPDVILDVQASWRIRDNAVVWDAFVWLSGRPRSIFGDRVMLASFLPSGSEVIDQLVREAVDKKLRALD